MNTFGHPFMRTLLYLIIIIFISCTSHEVKETANTTPVKKDTVKQEPQPVKKDTVKPVVAPTPNDLTYVEFKANNYFNNVTAVLSGLKGKAHDLNFLFDTLAWSRHQFYVDSSWKRLEARRLKSMRNWAANEFSTPNTVCNTLFYPFSGPDFLTANTFFPNADKIIMLGLEPVGKLPELKKFKPGEHSMYSANFKQSLGDIFDKSYFITRKMLQDFSAQKVNGLLPILTFFIRKTGNEISDIKYVYRYSQDSIVERPYNTKMPDIEDGGIKKPFGVRVDYVQNSKNKSVYYFKYDVSNKKFNDTCVFYNYINKNKNVVTYIKSASYLLHNNFMSNMKDVILKNSSYVIQDDTGIPYKFFTENNAWEMKLYGAYTRPVSDFPYLDMQKPLQEAFEKDSSKIGKLPFHLGYHWGSKKDVIIYASKK